MVVLLWRTLQSLPLVFRQRFKIYDQLFEIGRKLDSISRSCDRGRPENQPPGFSFINPDRMSWRPGANNDQPAIGTEPDGVQSTRPFRLEDAGLGGRVQVPRPDVFCFSIVDGRQHDSIAAAGELCEVDGFGLKDGFAHGITGNQVPDARFVVSRSSQDSLAPRIQIEAFNLIAVAHGFGNCQTGGDGKYLRHADVENENDPFTIGGHSCPRNWRPVAANQAQTLT